MPEVTNQLKNNFRERINAIPDLVTKPLDTVTASVEKLISLQPVKAATYLVEHAGDGVVSFINKQADITKRWMS